MKILITKLTASSGKSIRSVPKNLLLVSTGTIFPASMPGFSSLRIIWNLYFGSWMRSASDAPSYIVIHAMRAAVNPTWASENANSYKAYKSTNYLFSKLRSSYLPRNSIKNSNNAWQAATESDPNQTCQNNTKDRKEHIKCEKNHSQPAEIQN